MRKVDVAIIGGGIAGCAAAFTLANESNLDVLLIESHKIGANQSVRVVFSEAIEQFDLQSTVLQDYCGFGFHSPLGAVAKFDYRHQAASAVDYEKVCQLLFQRAQAKGVQFCQAKAVKLSPYAPEAEKQVTILLNSGEEIQAQVLLDASGPAQWAIRQIGVKQSPYFSVCYGELLTNCVIDDERFFWFLGPSSRYGNGGGWFYPTGKDTASIGYSIVVDSRQKRRRQLVDGYWAAKDELPPFSHMVEGGLHERVEGGMIPVGKVERFSYDRILLIGDAGGQANPWSVEGCRPGLVNGRLAAQVVIKAFQKKQFDQATLAVFDQEWAKDNRERFWRTASVAELTWNRSDEKWDQFIALYNQLPADLQLRHLRDNQANWFQQIYAVGGYARRQMAKWLRQNFSARGH